jgi:hypothetical protein
LCRNCFQSSGSLSLPCRLRASTAVAPIKAHHSIVTSAPARRLRSHPARSPGPRGKTACRRR